MYAIIQTGGKQVKVEVGQEIFVEKLEVGENETYTFDKVLLVSGEKSLIGNPYVNAKVVAKVVKQGKGKKLVIFKYKDKNNDKVKKGHRQPYTKLVIEAITLA